MGDACKTEDRPAACPWLIQRFIDPEAEILYVRPSDVLSVAERDGAIPFDVPGVELTHSGSLCSFDAFLTKYRLDDPGLARLARIVRAADTDTLGESREAAGLLAISLGLGINIRDDLELLEAARVVYDALYAWCSSGQGQRHDWNPDEVRATMAKA